MNAKEFIDGTVVDTVERSLVQFDLRTTACAASPIGRCGLSESG